jgi:hypothetical protein
MQKPGRLDLICYQGADFDFQITWTVSGSPVNLTGWTGRMQVRKIPGAPSATLSLTSGSGITLGGAAGTVLVAATATQTAAIIPGTTSSSSTAPMSPASCRATSLSSPR